MCTPSFVKIPDGELKIPKNLVELTWNDPKAFTKNFIRPSFMYNSGKIMSSGFAKGSFLWP